MSEIDWDILRHNAFEVMQNAYAPYSGYPVGAAARTVDGRMVLGCNVENVSYGLGLCAECVLVGNLCASGGGRLLAIAVCDSRGVVLMPCGRCRQLLYEHGGAELLVDHEGGPVRLGSLLPDAFGPDDLSIGQQPV